MISAGSWIHPNEDQEQNRVETRHLVTKETTTFLSTEAAKSALSEAKLVPEEIDLILAATITPDHVIPSLACEVQRELGAVNAVAFDICAACSGFLFALNTAYAYLKTAVQKRARDRSGDAFKDHGLGRPVNLRSFGDGAGAAV